MGGCKGDHKGGAVLEIGVEHLEVGEAVTKEPLNVVVLPLEDLQGLKEDGLDPQEGGAFLRFSYGLQIGVLWCPFQWGSQD